MSVIIDTDALIDNLSAIKKLKVLDLKKKLGMRKLPKTGNKNSLIGRLLPTIENSVNANAANEEHCISQSETTCTSLKGNKVRNDEELNKDG